MTEEEKELLEKMKQHEYRKKELEKKLEKLHNDTAKGTKKSFIVKLGRTITAIIMGWSGLGFLIVGLLLIFAIKLNIDGLKSFDGVIDIEEKYNIKLKSISREVQEKNIIYKVKLSKWKYRKIKPTVVRNGRICSYDDIEDRCIKYIIENIKDKKMLEGFEILETFEKYDILEYNLIYKIQSKEQKDEAVQKVQELQNYVMNFDKKFNKKIIKNIEERIKVVDMTIQDDLKEEVSLKTSFFVLIENEFLPKGKTGTIVKTIAILPVFLILYINH